MALPFSENTDPVQSEAWQSVPQNLQERLIDIQGAFLTGYLLVMEEIAAKWDFSSSIHHHLGTVDGFYHDFIEQLEMIAKEGQGGILDEINKYITQYRTIEQAAKQIALKRVYGNPLPPPQQQAP